jgi:PAS domain-containing protein
METFRLADGRDRYYWSVKIPLFTDQGEMYALLGMSTDMTERKHLEDELLRLATTDDLTRLSNRRHFLEQAESTLSRSRRYNEPLALLMCDIDFFKNINDTFRPRRWRSGFMQGGGHHSRQPARHRSGRTDRR